MGKTPVWVVMKRKAKGNAENHKKNMKEKSHWTQIKMPQQPSEFEIQSYIHKELKERGHNIRGEVSALTRSKFDLVVFASNGVPMRIIEVKKQSAAAIERLANRTATGLTSLKSLQKQIRQYLSYGLPVDLVMGMDHACEYVERFKINDPSNLPEELLALKGWDGAVTADEWLSSTPKIKPDCDRFYSMFYSTCRSKGWDLQKIKFDKDVGTIFCKAIDPKKQLRCLVEIGHGIPSEPDDVKARRIQAGRDLAKEHVAFLVRIEGETEIKRVCKRSKDRKLPFFVSSHLTDSVTARVRRDLLMVEKSGLSEEFRSIVAG